MVQVIDGALKDYAWGVVDGLVPWCPPTGDPQAELWFGRHRAGPSPIADGSGVTLADLPEHDGMPLVKLLAAAKPLSIQVHPDAARASAGFALDRTKIAADRRYSDAAEKSEMLVALTTFDAHAGWREPAEASLLLSRAGASDDIVDVVAHGDRSEAVRVLLSLTRVVIEPIEQQLISAAIALGWTRESVAALSRVLATYPHDPGVLVTVLMQHYRLLPGVGLAVPAGVVHSYVDGMALEVMTSSDNVLRLGLTPKPIAIDDALAAVRPDREPVVLDIASELNPPGMPFRVAAVVDGGHIELVADTHHVVVCLEGQCRVGTDCALPGQAIVVPPLGQATTAHVTGRAMVVAGDQPPG